MLISTRASAHGVLQEQRDTLITVRVSDYDKPHPSSFYAPAFTEQKPGTDEKSVSEDEVDFHKE